MVNSEASLSPTKLNSKQIKFRLESEPNKYKILENDAASKSVQWWKIFGFPAELDENGKFKRIPGHISCFNCYSTFIYGHSSGTTRFKEHSIKCLQKATSTASEDNELPARQSALPRYGFKRNIKVQDDDVEYLKKLCAQWLCQDLRPFCTIEDVGFRALAQELVYIGMFILFCIVLSRMHFYFLLYQDILMVLLTSIKFYEVDLPFHEKSLI